MHVQTKERPIIMTSAQVRAVLDGSKTQHRVPIRNRGGMALADMERDFDDMLHVRDEQGAVHAMTDGMVATWCPLGQPGNRLWVRETWADAEDFGHYTGKYHYRATYTNGGAYDDVSKNSPWRSPMHMRRIASRITLEITEVRVQALDEMNDADVLAEGYTTAPCKPGVWLWDALGETQDRFCADWDKAHRAGERFFDNPWVWAVTFKLVEA